MYRQKSILLTTALAFALTGSACDVNDTDRAPVATPTATPPVVTATPVPGATGANVSVADLISNWTNYEGKTVTVVAEVEDVLGPRAFTLDEDDSREEVIDDDLLVLSPKAGVPADVDGRWRDDHKVRVTGVVRRFVAADVEREIGWDLAPQLEAEYEGKKPVLIAKSIERAP